MRKEGTKEGGNGRRTAWGIEEAEEISKEVKAEKVENGKRVAKGMEKSWE